MITYLFPGQGSQFKGMGNTLFAEFPHYVEQANAILGYSLIDLCLNNPGDHLNQTQFTQPALFVVNALSYLKKCQDAPPPNFVAGHSLGEYSALFAAQVFDFETGLTLVKKRGELMSQAKNGGMAAVIGLNTETIHTVLQEQQLNDVTIANYNSFTQIVITGSKNTIHSAQPLFEKAGAQFYLPLNTSGAFHSPHMKMAQDLYAQFLKQFTFYAPTLPVIANVTAKPYDAHAIPELLAQQIISPVQWTATIEHLLTYPNNTLVEIGPGTVLTNLVRRIQNGQ